jgi:hypothetical protein
VTRDHTAQQEGRRLALSAIFEADFGQTTLARSSTRSSRSAIRSTR